MFLPKDAAATKPAQQGLQEGSPGGRAVLIPANSSWGML